MYRSEESGLFEYATAKIMKLMLAKELNKRLKASSPAMDTLCHCCVLAHALMAGAWQTSCQHACQTPVWKAKRDAHGFSSIVNCFDVHQSY